MIIIKIFSFNQVDTFYMLHVGEKSRMKFQHCQDKEWIFPNTACNIVTKNLHFFPLSLHICDWSTEMSFMLAKFNFDFSTQPKCIIKNATIWCNPYYNWTFGCKDIRIFFLLFKNYVKHKNLSPFLFNNSKPI